MMDEKKKHQIIAFERAQSRVALVVMFIWPEEPVNGRAAALIPHIHNADAHILCATLTLCDAFFALLPKSSPFYRCHLHCVCMCLWNMFFSLLNDTFIRWLFLLLDLIKRNAAPIALTVFIQINVRFFLSKKFFFLLSCNIFSATESCRQKPTERGKTEKKKTERRKNHELMENAASFSFVSWILNNLWAWLAHTSSDSNKTIIQQAFDGCSFKQSAK